jgi:hypothetical protein
MIYLYINDEDVASLLAPIFGQYGIKPIDFVNQVCEEYSRNTEFGLRLEEEVLILQKICVVVEKGKLV